MAKNLLQKLNTLIQSSIHDAVKLPRLGKNIDRQMNALRKQMAVAEEDEQAIIQRKEALSAEILQWDEQADQALAAKNESQARYDIQQMETAKRRLTMLESELDEHRRAMSDLYRQINNLEGIITAAQKQPESAEPAIEEPSLAEAIQQARETVQPTADAVRIQIEEVEPVAQDDAAIDADLKVRRSRLAKPD